MKKYYKKTKTEADYLLRLDIHWLKVNGYLGNYKKGGMIWQGGRNKDESIGIEASMVDNNNSIIRLFYALIVNDQKTNFDYLIKLVATNCNYGGKRFWFICPLEHNGINCGRKIAVLYKKKDYFGCRHCQNLSYSSRNRNRRHKDYWLIRTLTIGNKIEAQKLKCKRKRYAGRLTKNQEKLFRLYDKIRPP